MRIPAVFAIVALLALAGCGDDGEPVAAGGSEPTGPAGSEPVAPAGEYRSVEVTEGGEPHPVVDGTAIALWFEDGRMRIHAGCNHLSSDYTIDDGVLVAAGVAGTEMGCPAELHDQDQWLAELFSSSPTLAPAEDGFTVTGGTTTIRFVERAVVEPDAELVGTQWVVTGFLDGDSAMSTAADTHEAFLELGPDGFVVGHDGCNSLGWAEDGDDPSTRQGLAYTVGDGELTFEGSPVQTQVGCDGDDQVRFRAVLSGTVRYEIEARSLTLLAGDRGVTYVAAG